jgi:hypothetical protein
MRPILDDGHHAVGADSDEDVCPVANRCSARFHVRNSLTRTHVSFAWYTPTMDKKTTLNEIGEMLAHVVKHMATKDDIAALRTERKTDIVRMGEQVTSIEAQLRDMKHTKLHARVADLEEKVFGATRA